MNWFRKKEPEKKEESVQEFATPPPFGNALIPPPLKPKSLENVTTNVTDFKGFSPPPKFEFDANKNQTYDEDYSKYTPKNFIDSSTYDDGDYYKYEDKKKLFDFQLSTRARACVESIKMGVKMGSMVGGIFGSLTGIYASFSHKNFFIFPVSLVGGAVSFGFFLGCGMIVRC